jgi:energy-coupling factor transporter ATP-binding protein EcfA2
MNMPLKNKEAGPESIPADTEFELIGLEAENIKALKAVKLGFKGHSLVVVGGNNAQGKTSLLDSIAIALGGKKHEPEEVIRRGESHGRVVLDLDEVTTSDNPIGLKVTVVFTKKAGRKLVLEAKDGSVFRSPQEIFDRFISRLTFDPLEFVRMDKEKQVEVVRKMAGIDFEQLDSEYNGLYQQRRDLNRDLKGAEAVAEKIGVSHVMQTEPIDIGALISQRDQIVAENRKNDERKAKVERLGMEIAAKWVQLKEVQGQIEQLQAKELVLSHEAHEMEEKFNDFSGRALLLTWTDTTHIDQQIFQAQEINAFVEKKKFRDEQLSKVKSIQEQVDSIEGRMEKLKEQKARTFSQAHYPVPGFKIDPDGCLFYQDLPFSQASGMQQIDVAIDMALAINPRLKLALVREGSIIDLDNLKRIHERVESMGGKLIMERTGKSDEMSVIITNGEIEEDRLVCQGKAS